jgi:Flp pilus assembly pilin Flp
MHAQGLETRNRWADLWRRDDGAQAIEYALIVGVISIVLAVSLRDAAGTNFSDFIAKVGGCLTGTCN